MELPITLGPWKISQALSDKEQICILNHGPHQVIIAEVPRYADTPLAKESIANSTLIVNSPDLYETLLRIMRLSENIGRKGCTYGDTDMDSESVVYGYNQCLLHVKSIIEPIISKLNK